MRLPVPLMPSPRILAVDSGAGHAACALFGTDKSGRFILESFQVDAFNPDVSREADWSNMLGQSFLVLAKAGKLSGPARVALPGHHVLTKFIKTPSIEKSKRDKIVAFEAQQNIPYSLDEVVWDYAVIEDNGVDLQVLLAAVKTDVVSGVCAALSAAGLAPAMLQPSCVTLHRAFRHAYPEQVGGALVVAIGARSTNLLYVEGDRYFARTIALAGNSVTLAIVESLGQEFPAAERLKIQVLSGEVNLPETSPARTAVNSAVASFVARLTLEITRSTVNYRRHSSGGAPAIVFLTGGGSLIPGLCEQLGEKLKLPVESFDPLRNIALADPTAREHAAILTDLVGLAVPFGKSEQMLNLVPAAVSSAQAFVRTQPWWLGAAALLALALALPGLHYGSVAAVAQRRIAEIEQAAAPLQSLQARNTANLAELEAARAEIAALNDVVETKNNWINFFTDLQDRLVSVNDVWLEKLEVVRPTGAVAAAPHPAAGGLFSGGGNDFEESAAPPSPELLRLNVTGRLLDRANPVSRVSQESYNRVRSLLGSFVDSPYIAAVENERFDPNTPGLLRFDFILVVNPGQPL